MGPKRERTCQKRILGGPSSAPPVEGPTGRSTPVHGVPADIVSLMYTRLPVVIFAMSAAFILTGCSADGPVVKEVAETAEAPSATPTETPKAVEAAVGTRENPVPVGTPAKHSERSMWTFTVAPTDTEAWPEVLASNEFNSAPADGSTYIVAPVHIGADDIEAAKSGADPWASFQWEYVTAGGNSFGSTTCSAVLPAPGDLSQLGTMYGGAQGDFLASAVVPNADIAGGTWKVSSLIDAATGAFFVGASAPLFSPARPASRILGPLAVGVY